jgi:hypothetical protein
MTYMPINLSEIFPIGTIGHRIIYNPLLIQNADFSLSPKDSEYKPMPKKRLERVEKAILEVFFGAETPNSDEILRQSGFYDSTDSRSCIRKKRE